MKIEKKKEASTLLLSIEGRLDTNTSPELEKEINNLEGVETIIFNLEKLEYISSAGLRVFLLFHKKMMNKGRILIKNVTPDVKNIFSITGFNDILEIEEVL